MKYTVKQFAQKMNLDYLMASALLKAAVSTGQAHEVAKIKTSLTGRGKPATVYEVSDVISFQVQTEEFDKIEIV
jgi:hypothetical protein